MRSYWVKIALKAFAIFAVGMILVTGFRKAKGSINHAINSSDPIPIPVMGAVPFNLDNDKLGSVSRVEFLRSDPEHVSGVRVLIKLADSVSPSRLAACQLALDDVERINDQTTFRCAPMGEDTHGLEPFGVVAIKNSSDTFPLLLPASVTTRLRETSFSIRNGKIKVESPPSPAELMSARTDSLREEVESLISEQSDSIDNLKDRSDELEDSASNSPRDQRRALQHSADSVRARMRELVDRMKGNEGRLHALEKLSQMREMQGNWQAHEGATISDSVSQFVNQELSRVQQELERQGITGVRVNVQLDSIAAAAVRQGMRGGRATGTGRAASGTGQPATTSVEAPAAAPKAKAAPKAAPTPPVAPAPAVEKP